MARLLQIGNSVSNLAAQLHRCKTLGATWHRHGNIHVGSPPFTNPHRLGATRQPSARLPSRSNKWANTSIRSSQGQADSAI